MSIPALLLVQATDLLESFRHESLTSDDWAMFAAQANALLDGVDRSDPHAVRSALVVLQELAGNEDRGFVPGGVKAPSEEKVTRADSDHLKLLNRTIQTVLERQGS